MPAALPAPFLAAAALPRRTVALLWAHGPLLAAIWLAGDLAQSALREVAVQIGLVSRLGGLATLTLAVLVRLVTIVAMFRLLEPRAAPSSPARTPAPRPATRAAGFAEDMALVLVPFFLYYTAWGFLNDALRSYSLVSLEADPLASAGPILSIDARWGAALWVGVAWLIRRFAKARQKRSGLWLWPFLVVLAETMWVFLGLYILSGWTSALQAWLATLPGPGGWWEAISGAAHAAVVPEVAAPIDRAQPGASEQARALFFYALLPVIWFNLGAIIRGHDPGAAPSGRLSTRAIGRWQRLPGPLRDFAGHFFIALLKRWNAVAAGVRMMIAGGVPLMVALVVLFRATDWLAAWGWLGTARLLSPLGFAEAQVAQVALDILFGPARAPGSGLVPELARVALVSAALDIVQARLRVAPK